MVSEPPVVCLVTSQTRAVDPGLLAGSNTYDLKHRYKTSSRLAEQRLQSELHSRQAIRKDLPQITCSSLRQRTSVGN